MTYENCLKYSEEYEKAGNEKLALFWKARAKRRAELNGIKEEPPKEEAEEIKEEVKKKEKVSRKKEGKNGRR